jgi:GNAT superfamily N-acetyltransferase
MSKLVIKEAVDYDDAVIISKQTAQIWNSETGEETYKKMNKYINKFKKGFIIAKLSNEIIGSSIAFPMDHIPDFDEVNNRNIYDLINLSGKYFYIHIIQLLPGFRNRGFGIRLLKHQLKTAEENKFSTVIGMGIDRELDLWKKCGFTPFGEFGKYKNFGRFKWLKKAV